MKYKVGDKVIVCSLQEIYAKGYMFRSGPSGSFIELSGGYDFVQGMQPYCNTVQTIESVEEGKGYKIVGESRYIFTDEMFRGKIDD